MPHVNLLLDQSKPHRVVQLHDSNGEQELNRCKARLVSLSSLIAVLLLLKSDITFSGDFSDSVRRDGDASHYVGCHYSSLIQRDSPV